MQFRLLLESSRDTIARLERINYRNKLILNTASEGILGLNSQGRHTFVNPAAARMLGYSVDELLDGHSHPTWHHTKTDGSPYPEEECPIYGSYNKGVVCDCLRNEVFWRKDGTSFPVAYTSTPIIENGEVSGAVVTFIDITERKKAEDALKMSEENFRRLMDRNPVATAVADKSGKFIYFDGSFIETFGYTLEDIPTVDDWWPLAYPDEEYRQKVISSWRAAARKAIKNRDQTESQEWRVRCKDGSSRCIEFRMASLQDVNIVIFNDITERKQTEEALLQSEARYRRITEGLTDYQYTVRIENGRAVETKHSPACVAVTGYTAEEFAADPYLWIRMVAPEDRELIIKRVEQILEGNDILPIEHRIIRKDGILRWVSDNIILYRDLSGILLSYDGVVKDISERKRAEEERDKLIVELQEALAKVKHLSGLLPICASCKKIRNDKGFWEQVEAYISEHSEALFSHAICPECGKKLYPEYYNEVWGEKDK